ncbi:MAG: EamA family transporter RarD [Yaniella sp.]|uniref:EamA family transporter RarD n=1 Tax=Yaniella sp. TaxID=2773929 RepID=UPI001839A18C|nr:EamA family transporter RarD [Yaniella sp.]NLZ98447.1 EamA family transporter RarD [Micrococcus sp.]MDN5705087.1 EamA family transporter RarD [Yaniella sp.]MDN5730463.1 EamA family transporter RarD [Yaniella sp.]MDN5742879.1 EamA family transporter RarD [Yaniella sp.]MDN5815684.1 EamA family transporter RarD [Yaniella sp.]
MASADDQVKTPANSAGLVQAFLAYSLWGALPIVFAVYMTPNPVDLLAWRIVLALGITLVTVAIVRGGWRRLGLVLKNRRDHLLLILAGHLIAVNWGLYIYAVASYRVLEASLGYFINPLMTIVLGVVLLGERLRPLQWIAVGVSLVAVIILTIDYGNLPWVSLTLAISFAFYGLVKNKLGPTVDSLTGLTVETMWLSIPSTAWIVLASMGVFATAGGIGVFESFDTLRAYSLPVIGLVTVVPLILFAGAAARLPLSTVGMFQYIAPIAQFLFGYFVFEEVMSTGRWIGFILVWVAVLILIGDALRQIRQNPKLRIKTSQQSREEKVDYQA